MSAAGPYPLCFDEAALSAVQAQLGADNRPDWQLMPGALVGGCFVAFERGGVGAGAAGDPGWAGAALVRNGEVVHSLAVEGVAGWPYVPGLLALREGPLLMAALSALPCLPDILMVNATGLDHPRGGGLAVHLGALLGVPSLGVTDRPLLASGLPPGDEEGAASRLEIEGRAVAVAASVRVRAGVRPLVVHPGWRMDLATARAVVTATVTAGRTPLPIREARHRARVAREQARRAKD